MFLERHLQLAPILQHAEIKNSVFSGTLLLAEKFSLARNVRLRMRPLLAYRVLDVLLDLSEGVVQESPSNSLSVRKIEQRGGLFKDEFAQYQSWPTASIF